jgi:plastocyanin
MFVDDVSVFTEGNAIRLGDERMRLTGVPTLPLDRFGNLPPKADRGGVLIVERGVLNTTPLEHSTESEIYKYDEPAQPAAITQSACGQTAQAPAPVGTPGLVEDFTGQTVEVSAVNVAFNVREIRVNANGQVRVRFNNQEATPHNIAFYKSSSDITPVSPGSVGITFPGPAIDDTVFAVPAAGTYHFRCDVHPTIMTGSFIVQ